MLFRQRIQAVPGALMSPVFFPQQANPFPLPMGVKRLSLQPGEKGLPPGADLHAVGVFRAAVIQWSQFDIVVPHGDVLVSLPTADAFGVEPDDVDRVRAERDAAKQPKAIGGRAADLPCCERILDRLKRGIRRGDGLQRAQMPELLKDRVPVCRENGGSLDEHINSPSVSYTLL